MSLNKVSLIGNIGKDPEIRTTQDQSRKIANFSIATSERWKDKATQEKKEKTEWHRVVIFKPNLVELTEKFLKKGSKIYLEGSLQTRKYTDKSGIEKYTTEIILKGFDHRIEMLDKKDNSSTPPPVEDMPEGVVDEVSSEPPF